MNRFLKTIAVPAPLTTLNSLGYLNAVTEKYAAFSGNLTKLINWCISVRHIQFDEQRIQKWPDLRGGITWQKTYAALKPALDNLDRMFEGNEIAKEALKSQQIGLFGELFSLVLRDQREDYRVASTPEFSWVLGVRSDNLSLSMTLIHSGQIIAGTLSDKHDSELVYSKNLGDRIAFSVFQFPTRSDNELLFENRFFNKEGEEIPSSHVAFTFICPRPDLPDIYIQNKVAALQTHTVTPNSPVQHGLLIFDGIPSTNMLNWLIQRNVQEVKLCPNVEVVVLLKLPVQTATGIESFPYLLTIKHADNFRWKKDNLERAKALTYQDKSELLAFVGKDIRKKWRSEQESNRTHLKNAYRDAKKLIKSNLKWTPAHEIMIQLNKERPAGQDGSEAFWEMVRLKEAHSGLPKTAFASLTQETIPAYLRESIHIFLGWMVAMANHQEESVPPSIRMPLRPQASQKRLCDIDPTCKQPDGTFHLPDDIQITHLVNRLTPIFTQIWESNRSAPPHAYCLPMAPIIGDFLADHIDFNSTSFNIRQLDTLKPEHLESDFKAQVNYSLSQAMYLLRYSPRYKKIQASEHLAVRKKYQAAEELAKEFEQGLLQSYVMYVASLPPESAQNPPHIQAVQDFIAKVEEFGRGDNIKKIWTQLYSELKLNRSGIPSIKDINKLFTGLGKKKKQDLPIDSIEGLHRYYQTLYYSFSFFGMQLETIKSSIEMVSHRYSWDETELQNTNPRLLGLLQNLKPLSDVSSVKSALIPLLFENISPSFLPIEPDDRLLAMAFPPANFTTHWVKYIYIVDTDMSVKVSPEMLTGKQKGKRISHSQLSNWGPVMAAGEVYFAKLVIQDRIQWVCMEINNGSGHYEPDAEGSLMVAREAIENALQPTDILYDPRITAVRNVLLPGVPAHSFLK